VATLNKALADLLVAANRTVTNLTTSLNGTNASTVAEAYVSATTVPTTPTRNTNTQAQLHIAALNTVNALLANNPAAQSLALAPNGSTLYSAVATTQKSLYVAATTKAPNHPDATALATAIASVTTPIRTLIAALQKADATVITDIITLSRKPAPITRAKATALGNQYTKNMTALAASIAAMNGTAKTPSATIQQAAQIVANQLPRATLPTTISLPNGVALSPTLYTSTIPHPDAAALAAVIRTLK
jgi:hypothetical protein